MIKDNSSFLRRAVRTFRHSTAYCKGLPAGFPENKLDDFIRSSTNDTPVAVSHRHVSGWKAAGAFRVQVKLESGEYWTFIFKDAIYNGDQIPALAGLPLRPGPPEYWIYQNCGSSLQEYLPKVYFCRRYPNNLHYQYFLEDLRPEFRPVADDEELLIFCRLVPRIQKKLSSLISQETRANLLKYDIEFSTRLLNYAAANLSLLHEDARSSFDLTILRKWSEIEDLYQSNMEMAYATSQPQVIHGDSNLSNILISRAAADNIRLIDWEWAGIGLPHMDLASVLKNAKPLVEAAAIQTFTQKTISKKLRSDIQIFQWCKLQRCLFDAAFFLRQTADLPPEKIGSLDDHIKKALSRALQAVSALSEVR